MYRRSSLPSLWSEVDRLQREMNQLYGTVRGRRASMRSYPAVNVWTNEESALITAEVPGMNPDELQISVVGETLTLSGERKADEAGEGTRYHRRERGFGRFTRTIELPFRVDADKVEAVFRKGVLQITLPRAEADKPRRIEVKAT